MSVPAQIIYTKAYWEIIPAKLSHVERMLPRIRDADRRELWQGWRHTPEYSLRYGIEHSSHAWTACVNFEPVCMYGVVPASIIGGTGAIWLIGTQQIEQYQLGFLRRSRPQLQRIKAMYSHLSNYVAADNMLAIGWISWLGFTLSAAAPYGPDAAYFRYFEWSKNV